MPPAWLEAKPPGIRGSLFSEPSRRAALKPAPISTPLTAPMDITAPANAASSLSKTGSPSPGAAPDPHLDHPAQGVFKSPDLLHPGLHGGHGFRVGTGERVIPD